MKKVREIRAQLLDIMTQTKLDVNSCGSDWDVVRKAVCSGYFHNSAKLKGIGEYINQFTSMPCYLHPSSALYGAGYTPDYIVYHELVYTTKEYMRCVTAADPFWLAELGPLFFSIKEGAQETMSRKVREKLNKKMMQEEMDAKEGELAEEKRQQEELERAKISRERQQVATPFSRTPGTPNRSPRRFGI
eukprot:c16578_g1_i1.p1 GENE.c16578_g1_i1~~c16578_g1_i1.p1  ORF type:complete len:197 (+),score=63.58 c16578_g1_i1:26-592(+)